METNTIAATAAVTQLPLRPIALNPSAFICVLRFLPTTPAAEEEIQYVAVCRAFAFSPFCHCRVNLGHSRKSGKHPYFEREGV
jgi:hypothetical protein